MKITQAVKICMTLPCSWHVPTAISDLASQKVDSNQPLMKYRCIRDALGCLYSLECSGATESDGMPLACAGMKLACAYHNF